MRRAVDGRFKVVFFETALPPLKVVTVTLLTGFLTAFGFGASKTAWTSLITWLVLAVCEVLRVLRFFGAVAFGVVGTDDLTGIRIDSFVYSSNIAKNPHCGGFSGRFVNCLIL